MGWNGDGRIGAEDVRERLLRAHPGGCWCLPPLPVGLDCCTLILEQLRPEVVYHTFADRHRPRGNCPCLDWTNC
jgi:hypothetical protein